MCDSFFEAGGLATGIQMTISQQELGRRLKAAREARNLTQDHVGGQLQIPRSSVAQMELGNRAVTSIELQKLAALYGREMAGFFAEEFEEADALVTLYRAEPRMGADPAVQVALGRWTTLFREVTFLEEELGSTGRRVPAPECELPVPKGKWEGIQQGEGLAGKERVRLDLGQAPVWDVAEILEPQGIRCAIADLPDQISGLFLASKEIGLCVIVNGKHHPRRRTFSFVHEYAHVLVDRKRRALVSETENRDDLIEVRANAFAAAFLLPEAGVRDFFASSGKGKAGRSIASVFDEEAPVLAQNRDPGGSQDIQVPDVVHMACRFGVSYETAVYRLRNLGLLRNDEERDRLLEKSEAARELRALLDPADRSEAPRQPDPFRHRFVVLLLEALRREAISRRRFLALVGLLDLTQTEAESILRAAGLDRPIEFGPDEIRLPR